MLNRDFYRIVQSLDGNHRDQWFFRSVKNGERERSLEEFSDSGGFGSVGEGTISPSAMLKYSRMNESLSSDRSVFCVNGGQFPVKNVTDRVTVQSSDQVAEIVGRNGSKVKALRIKYGAYIETPARGSNNTFVVTGRPADVKAVKEEIEIAADHFAQIRASRQHSQGKQIVPGHITLYVPVQYSVVGLVVGMKGATIKRIQQETHTYIITPSRNSYPVFQITGTPENADIARRMIETYVYFRTGNQRQPPQDYLTHEITQRNNTDSIVNCDRLLGMLLGENNRGNCEVLPFPNDQKADDDFFKRFLTSTTELSDKLYETSLEEFGGNEDAYRMGHQHPWSDEIKSGDMPMGNNIDDRFSVNDGGSGLDSFPHWISDHQNIEASNHRHHTSLEVTDEPTNEIFDVGRSGSVGVVNWLSQIHHQNRSGTYSLF